MKDFGKLDVIVANAGICSEHAGEDYTQEEFLEIMNVNVNGAFYTAQAAAKIFKQQGFGNIVFTASVSASLVNTPQRQASVSHGFWIFLEIGIWCLEGVDLKSLIVQCFQGWRSAACSVTCG